VSGELPVARGAACTGDLPERARISDRGHPGRACLSPASIGTAEGHLVPDIRAIRLEDKRSPVSINGEGSLDRGIEVLSPGIPEVQRRTARCISDQVLVGAGDRRYVSRLRERSGSDVVVCGATCTNPDIAGGEAVGAARR